MKQASWEGSSRKGNAWRMIGGLAGVWKFRDGPVTKRANGECICGIKIALTRQISRANGKISCEFRPFATIPQSLKKNAKVWATPSSRLCL